MYCSSHVVTELWATVARPGGFSIVPPSFYYYLFLVYLSTLLHCLPLLAIGHVLGDVALLLSLFYLPVPVLGDDLSPLYFIIILHMLCITLWAVGLAYFLLWMLPLCSTMAGRVVSPVHYFLPLGTY